MREQNESILCMRSRVCVGESRAPLRIEDKEVVLGAGGCAQFPLAVFHNTVFLTTCLDTCSQKESQSI